VRKAPTIGTYLERTAHMLCLRGPAADDPAARRLHSLTVSLLILAAIGIVPFTMGTYVATLFTLHRARLRRASRIYPSAKRWISDITHSRSDGHVV
jgi:hypothetical protein